MSSSNNHISEIELQAYVDDELDSVRRAEVEQVLQSNPELLLQVNEYQKINQDLQALYQPVLEKNIPESISSVLKPERKLVPFAQAASLFIAVFIGLILGWISRGEFALQPDAGTQMTKALVNDAFSYHAVYTPEVKHPVEVTADHQQHLVKWLSKRLSTEVKAPSLQSLGFELLGGRLLTTSNEPAAQFMYENTHGKRLTLFIRKREQNESVSSFRYASNENINGFYWTDQKLSFVILSDLNKNKISEIAHVVYEDLQ